MVVMKGNQTGRRNLWCVVVVSFLAAALEVASLNGPNVCMVKQKYNITKRVKYRAPMSVRTYEWCFSIPPRCSKWSTEMRDLTKLETEERIAEVAVCCPGYKMRDVSCVPICPNGRTGVGCSDACPPQKWGPNCVNECGPCQHGSCSPITGDCRCRDGWQGESCEISMPPITVSTLKVEVLTASKTSAIPTTTQVITTRATTVETKTTSRNETPTTMITTPFTTASTFQNIDIDDTTEYMNVLSPENLTATTHAQKSIMATTEAELIKTRDKPVISIYNTTDVLLNPNKIEVTPKSTINSTTVKQMAMITTESSMPVTEDDTNNSELIQKFSIEHSELSTDVNVFTMSSIKEKKYDIATSTNMPPILIPTRLSTTEKFNSQQNSVNNESKTTSIPLNSNETVRGETTQEPDVTIKIPTTVKFKPKEIWIKPASKGEMTESKKTIYDVTKHKIMTNKEFTINTTPKTIIVSIIPTSVSYVTFKKIALTTTSYLAQRNHTIVKSYNKPTETITKPIELPPTTTKIGLEISTTLKTTKPENFNEVKTTPITKTVDTSQVANTKSIDIETDITNTSMTATSAVYNSNSSNLATKASTFTDYKLITKRTTSKLTTPSTVSLFKTEHTHKYYTKTKQTNVTNSTKNQSGDDKLAHSRKDTKNLTSINKITTEDPSDEEIFHILTEPEHITAVMGEKERGRTSMDLVSVISIAGGIMLAIITVAVVIVMIERCKRPRYEDIRKINDIHMQVMIDNNDAPPPYVRSIFHTPLPDPPMSEKCHYQPISTLDRNLKQFMRPVVVQTISPIMLENFRGILECHYDHLPRRSHDFPMDSCCTITPSISNASELLCIQHNITDSTIEALKCEARMDVIDTTTSEPLYAEIPCWRPPSEHAIETLNLNGEAVTEL